MPFIAHISIYSVSTKRESRKAGLLLNIKKTKVLCTGRNESSGIIIDDQEVELVKEIVFLGSKITNEGSCTPEIKRRLILGRTAMTKLNSIWKDKDISACTKARIVRAMIFPVATYASETWTTTKSDRQRIQVSEMWCWRRMLRIPWTKKASNKSILSCLADPTTLDG